MQVDRRAFLKGSAAAALLAGGGGVGWLLGADRRNSPPLASPRVPELRSTGLRKCLSLGPIDAPLGDDQDLRTPGNLADVEATGSRWVKLWLRWDQAQPADPSRVPWSRLHTPANPGLPFLRALDAQIALARSRTPPIGVIVTLYRFPAWVNGTGGLTEGSRAEREFEAHDRMTEEQAAAGDPDDRRAPLAFRIPPAEQLAPDGAWGRWLRFLLGRYRRFGSGVVLELTNEPNLQWWPQQRPARGPDRFAPGEPEAPLRLAQMLDSARRVAAELDAVTPLAGPGVADYPLREPVPEADPRTFTSFDRFTLACLDELERIGFRAPADFIWTQHDYADTLLGLGRGSRGSNRAATTRELLRGRWSGWPQDGRHSDAPGLWLTEGGVDLRSERVDGDGARQARLVRAEIERLSARDGDGERIGMLTSYLNFSEPHFDSGLRAPRAAGGAVRPVRSVWAGWKSA